MHPPLSQLLKKIWIIGQLCQNLLDLRHHVVFVSERDFEADLGINNVSGSTKVHDHWYRAHCQRLKDHSASKLVNRRKDQHIDRSETP
ncbi:MAG: hypothetical protein WAO00_14890 [Chthoniobacterales bacterium]